MVPQTSYSNNVCDNEFKITMIISIGGESENVWMKVNKMMFYQRAYTSSQTSFSSMLKLLIFKQKIN